jgi:hypothetical protein
VPANANPAKVLNLSLGGSGACGTTYQDAINAIIAAGTTVVVSAGNSSADASGFRPANCNGVITVAATNRNGYKASYSNYGATVEISAPGGETSVSGNGVLSTLNTGTQGPVADTYVYYQGTSMAAPHVTGVVSLMYSRKPSLTPAQVLSYLQSTVTAFPAGSTCTTSNCGSGIVNAGAAVAAVPTSVQDKKAYLPLVLNGYPPTQATGPTPGFWQQSGGAMEFYVTADRGYVHDFAINVNVTGCGSYKITHLTQEPISGNSFSFTGTYYASGTFSSQTAASGTTGLSSFPISGCGNVSGGPWTWSANWMHSAQLMPAEAVEMVETNQVDAADPGSAYEVTRIP